MNKYRYFYKIQLLFASQEINYFGRFKVVLRKIGKHIYLYLKILSTFLNIYLYVVINHVCFYYI